MKLFCLTLSLAFGGLVLSPGAMAQFASDPGYQSTLEHQEQQAVGPAFNSVADTGDQTHDSDTSWGDVQYLNNSKAARFNVNAPRFTTGQGLVSTFKGTFGQKINGPNLPSTNTGLNAILSGSFRPAVSGAAGGGGFSGAGGGSSVYFGLPPTSTSTVLLDTAF